MTTSFIIKLLQRVEKFEKSGSAKSNLDVDDFRNWLNDEKYYSESPTKLFAENDKEVSFLENEICKQILLISRYARLAIRRGLQEFPELANEEFTYLYRVKDEPGLSKMMLIERNGHEKPTGMHIIKRLVEHNLVMEVDDPNDRRSKLIYLTEKGHRYFEQSVPAVDQISTFLSGDLSPKEKEILLKVLIKLNTFHYTNYQLNR